MNKLKSTTLALITASTCLLGASFNTFAMDKNVESALVDICKSAASNNVYRFNKAVKSYNLSDKEVALKVMCNGDDIIDFAGNHGAKKTAARLERSIGGVSITDVAAVSKLSVTFSE